MARVHRAKEGGARMHSALLTLAPAFPSHLILKKIIILQVERLSVKLQRNLEEYFEPSNAN